jgi:rRNA maturation endonuclease Nob1
MASVSEQTCGICGLLSSIGDMSCPRGGTIFPEKEVKGDECGDAYDPYIAMCPSCGGTLQDEVVYDEGRDEAVQRFQLIPGVTQDMAGKLYDKGIKSFSDLIGLSLPDTERRRGLHRIIARRLMLSGLMLTEKKAEDELACARCKGPLDANELKCSICGAAAGAAFLDLQINGHTLKLGEYMDELYVFVRDTVKGSAASKEIRSEITNAIAELDGREIEREEYRNQIEAWREKGFMVSELEALLDKDVEEFKKRSLELIKAQVRKREEHVLRCPLCDFLLKETWKECPNCGAKFNF